ncbi:MAG: hypothetical protein M1484_04675 [Patescibacteria group bacterium]|nr:hypothetical protein [Patescibacteria group bacterium]
MKQNKYQKKIERLLNSDEKKPLSDWQKGSKKRAEACRRAFIKGLKAGDKTE